MQKSDKIQNKLEVSGIVSQATCCGRQSCKGQNIWDNVILKEIVNLIFVHKCIIALYLCKIMACQGEVSWSWSRPRRISQRTTGRSNICFSPSGGFPVPLVLLLGCSPSWALLWYHRLPLPLPLGRSCLTRASATLITSNYSPGNKDSVPAQQPEWPEVLRFQGFHSGLCRCSMPCRCPHEVV